jgi:hypothetical protein
MGLRAKFNLAIVAAFLVGFSGAAILLQRLFVENARTQVLENARIMMSAADAIRHFADVQIGPIAAGQNDVLNGRFIAASVPSFAAQTTFKAIQASYPDFAYREPTLNPTNLDDRPADWEADYINAFRNNLTTQELIGERDTPTGRVLSLARPIAVNSADCLSCHSTAARAPTAMLATVGRPPFAGRSMADTIRRLSGPDPADLGPIAASPYVAALKRGPAEGRVSGLLLCTQSLERSKVEFRACLLCTQSLERSKVEFRACCSAPNLWSGRR